MLATSGSHNIVVGDIGNDCDLDIAGSNWEAPPVEIFREPPLRRRAPSLPLTGGALAGAASWHNLARFRAENLIDPGWERLRARGTPSAATLTAMDERTSLLSAVGLALMFVACGGAVDGGLSNQDENGIGNCDDCGDGDGKPSGGTTSSSGSGAGGSTSSGTGGSSTPSEPVEPDPVDPDPLRTPRPVLIRLAAQAASPSATETSRPRAGARAARAAAVARPSIRRGSHITFGSQKPLS